MKKSEIIPARVFVLTAKNSHNAVVLRRGPSAIVGVYSWNLENDDVQVRQWLKGRIYEYQSDLSPSGKYLIYSANKKGDGYTVISRAPWIKAISHWDNGGFWGGGIFLGNRSYMLYDGIDSTYNLKDKDLIWISRDILFDKERALSPIENALVEHGLYAARLVERGWSIEMDNKERMVFVKRLDGHCTLEKVFVKGGMPRIEGKGSYWEFHRIVAGNDVHEQPDWEWCEWIGGYLLWSEKGCLYRGALDEKCAVKGKKLVYDFNPDRFEERIAPY